MSDNFLNLPKELKRNILEGAESTLGIKPYLLEKDIWICWVLRELFQLPKKMAFKGGTSLSKCYGLLDRFSEDVDVNDVLMIKKAFFNASYANYDKCENQQFCLVPKPDEIAGLKADYEHMIKSDMFLHEPVMFDEVITELKVYK